MSGNTIFNILIIDQGAFTNFGPGRFPLVYHQVFPKQQKWDSIYRLGSWNRSHWFRGVHMRILIVLANTFRNTWLLWNSSNSLREQSKPYSWEAHTDVLILNMFVSSLPSHQSIHRKHLSFPPYSAGIIIQIVHPKSPLPPTLCLGSVINVAICKYTNTYLPYLTSNRHWFP